MIGAAPRQGRRRFRRFWALAAAFPLLGGVGVHAGAPAPYTLEDCLRLARERSLPLANARREEELADARYRQYRAQILPDLHGRAEYRRADEAQRFEFGGTTVPLGRLDNYSASVEVSQLIYDGGSVQAALRAARSYRARAAYGVERAAADLERDVRLAFHALLFAREAVAVEERRVEQFERAAREAELRFRRDTASEFDLLSARVRRANAEPALIGARRDLRLARSALRHLARIEEEEFEIAGQLEFDPRAPDWRAARRRALERRPELAQQRQNVALAEAALRVELAAYSPVFRARAGYRGTNPAGFGVAEDGWDWHWDAGLTVEWKFFDGAARPNRVREKRIERDQAAALLDEMERAVELEVEQAFLALRHAAEAVAAARATSELAERALEIARARHASGLATFLEFAESNVAAAEARLHWIGALRAHRDARARLEWACGAPLEEMPAAGEPLP